MKKIMMIFMVALLVFSLSGQAMAYFESGHLIRVVYDTSGTYEFATDLGAFSPTSKFSGHIVYSELFPMIGEEDGIFETAGWDDLRVAYFAISPAAAWTSGPLPGSQTSGSRQFTNYTSAATAVRNKYGSFGTASHSLLQSDLQSYYTKMDKSGLGAGTFNGLIPIIGSGEKSLAALSTSEYVDQYLYYYASPNSPLEGLKVATIRTFADGHTEVVPVPPALLLFGSGLLGLIGIRRKIAA